MKAPSEPRSLTFIIRTGTCERGTPDAWKERRDDCIARMAAGGDGFIGAPGAAGGADRPGGGGEAAREVAGLVAVGIVGPPLHLLRADEVVAAGGHPRDTVVAALLPRIGRAALARPRAEVEGEDSEFGGGFHGREF